MQLQAEMRLVQNFAQCTIKNGHDDCATVVFLMMQQFFSIRRSCAKWKATSKRISDKIYIDSETQFVSFQ